MFYHYRISQGTKIKYLSILSVDDDLKIDFAVYHFFNPKRDEKCKKSPTIG